MKVLDTKSLIKYDNKAGADYITYGQKVDKNLGKVAYEFMNACDKLVFGYFDLLLKTGRDGKKYLVLAGKHSDFEFLLTDDYELSFKDKSLDSELIGLSCPVATDLDIEISGAILKDYNNSYHHL